MRTGPDRGPGRAGARHGGAHAHGRSAVLLTRAADRARGAGYTPGGDVGVVFSLAGAHGSNIVPAQAPLAADAAGGINGRLPAPRLASDSDLRESATVRANDQARIGPTGPIGLPEDSFATTRFTLSAVDVLVLPWLIGHVNPRAQTTFKVMGWEPYRKVYAHYFLNGKRIKTVEIGSSAGRAGT